MIPKIIHYCWFGNAEYSNIIKKCILSWGRINPEYEIKFWNESNVPIKDYSFMLDAYNLKKYAFVSDYARYLILKNEGGFFLDTDVEALKSFDNLLDNKFICGFEKNVRKNSFLVNPGLLMACEANHPIIDLVLEYYNKIEIVNEFGIFNLQYTSPNVLTMILVKNYKLNVNNIEQKLANGIKIYPSFYFSPINPRKIFNKYEKTNNSYAIHYGEASWVNSKMRIKTKLSILYRIILGDKIVDYIKERFFKFSNNFE